VPRRVHRERVKIPTLNRIVISETLIDLDCSRRRRPNPGRLHVEHLQERVIVLVEQDRSARGLLQLHCPTDVIDVRMGDDDLLEFELVLAEDREDSIDFVAGIDDKCLACALVANDGAVTAEKADGEDLVDQERVPGLNTEDTEVTERFGSSR